MSDVRSARRLGWMIWRRSVLANLAGLAVMTPVALTTGAGSPADVPYESVVRTNIAGISIHVLVAALLAMVIVRLTFVRTFLAAGDDPSRSRQALLSAPAGAAAWSVPFWLAGAVWIPPVNIAFYYGPDGFPQLRVYMLVALGCLATSALIYLSVERGLRTALDLGRSGPDDFRPDLFGILTRLLVSWTLGSALFFLAIVAVPVGVDADRLPSLRLAVWVAAGGGLAFGLVTTIFAARAVSDPLRRVRAAMDRVAVGDLDVELDVDDGGEIGLLQAGFNRMAQGLRERRRLYETFGRYVGAEIIDELLGEEHAGAGHTEATVMFVDVIGSSRLGEMLPPDDVVEMLNALFRSVVRCVREQHGWVNRFVGDGALCVFGRPVGEDDHAARALRAALGIRQEVAALAERYPELDAAVGLSSGPVLVGPIGSDDRQDFTVIGDAANEASRLTDEAKSLPERVLAAESTILRSGETGARWTLREERILRGRRTPTRAYAPALG